MNDQDQMHTESQPSCVVCGASGVVKYKDLTDRLFGAPGTWTMKECSATGCGTLWLDPRPTMADIGKAYENYYTHGVDQQRSLVKRIVRALALEIGASRYGFKSSRLPWPGKYIASMLAALYPGLKERIELQIRYLSASSMGSGNLLDVGCGDGEALEILSDLKWKVQGVELDPQGVAASRLRNLDVRQGTLGDAAFPSGSFDALTSSHVIEHLHDPVAFISESHRVLKTGGTLILVTPNARAWTHTRYGPSWLNLDSPRHLVLFTVESLQYLVKAGGFRNIRVFTTTRAIALTEIASIKIQTEGHYQWQQWPGLQTWLRAQIYQWLAPIYLKLGFIDGDEIVVVANK
jgi:2-polyprenyl-3-methyl-5-hydroxy-6-metoxy-1,4-benzoquinol methylase